jgi:type II secretory pathway pseudopilin PulG
MTRNSRRPAQAGFTLIELLLALIVAAEVIIAAAMAFDFSNQAAAVQTQVTDMQQSLRIVQHDIARLVRMAGRGGLPAGIRPELEFDPSETIPDLLGMALEVRNGVTGTAARDRRIARGIADSPVALEGTDILTVRGCFTNPLYQLESETLTLDDPAAPTAATMVIRNESVIGIRQPLRPLCEELDAAGGGTLLLASPEGREVYGLGLITQDDCPAGGTEPDLVNLQLDLTFNSPLNPDQSADPTVRDRRFPPRMEAITACLLEEYRYFVQELHENPVDLTSPLRPRLVRARFEPGTELPYGGDAQNYALPLADGIIDLQFALGFDTGYPRAEGTTNIPGAIDDDIDFLNQTDDEVIFEAPVFANRNLDDWLYNHPDDVNNEGKALSPRWRVHDFVGRVGLAVQLYQVRVTTIARTNRADRTYQAPDFDPIVGQDFIEDHDYDTAPASSFKTVENRKFRRRALTTTIDLRNL